MIDRVAKGPDGSMFLTDPHTFTHFKTAHCLPELMDRARFESWEQKGEKDLFTRCNEKAKTLLKDHVVEPKPDEIEYEMDKHMNPADLCTA